jgi:hypothetical protein
VGSSREEIVEVFDEFDGALDRLCKLSFDVFTTPELLRALERLERGARRQRTPQHALINRLVAQAGEEELGGTLRAALADRLRINKADAGRRIAEAGDLGQRQALTGEPLAPLLSHTAAGQRGGLIGDAHVQVIRSFFAHLPVEVEGKRGLYRNHAPGRQARLRRRTRRTDHRRRPRRAARHRQCGTCCRCATRTAR